MKINTNSNNLNFDALRIAKAGNLDIYRISGVNDLKFLKTLPESVKTENLMPNLSLQQYSRWNEMLQYAVQHSMHPDNITYLSAVDNKPCGIITFLPDKITRLDCICTWPVEFGKKVKLAGQTLFYQLFRDFQIFNAKKIKLEAITNGPYDTVSKYEQLGFIQTDVLPTKVKMELSSQKAEESFKKLSERIDYELAEPERVNLFELFA